MAISAEFADYLPPALAYQLRPEADVLIVEPGGGLAVLTALRGDASSVTAVHSNPAAAAVVATRRRVVGDRESALFASRLA